MARLLLRIFFAVFALYCGCKKADLSQNLLSKEQVTLQGPAFGTSFTIKIVTKLSQDGLQDIREKIQKRLEEIDETFSNWRENSEVERFNRLSSNQAFTPSPAFFSVLYEAHRIYKLTNGAFDPAREELFSLWGFSAEKKEKRSIPSPQNIQRVLDSSGMHFLEMAAAKREIRKKHPQVKVNLSALAKGYAVDQTAQFLQKAGISSYMIEIGGEIRVGRKKPDSALWHIAVESPNYANKRSVFGIAHLENNSMASSGNYRNYFKVSNKIYSHILDPRSGYPVNSSIAAVTVIGPECMMSDALATSLMILTLKEGKKLMESLPEYEAVWIIAQKGLYTGQFSSGMKAYLNEKSN